MEKESPTLELLFDKIVESTRSTYELIARIDERVKFLLDHQSESEKRMQDIINGQANLLNRVVLLEAKNLDKVIAEIRQVQDFNQVTLTKLNIVDDRVKNIEDANESTWARVISILDMGIKVLVGALIGYLLYKIGVNPAFLK